VGMLWIIISFGIFKGFHWKLWQHGWNHFWFLIFLLRHHWRSQIYGNFCPFILLCSILGLPIINMETKLVNFGIQHHDKFPFRFTKWVVTKMMISSSVHFGLLAICHLDLGSANNTSLWTNDLKGTNLFCICKWKKNEGESEVNLTKGFGLLGLGQKLDRVLWLWRKPNVSYQAQKQRNPRLEEEATIQLQKDEGNRASQVLYSVLLSKCIFCNNMKSDSNRCKNWQLSLDQNTFFLKPKIWMIKFVLVLAIGFIYSIFSFWSVNKESWWIQKGLRGKENCCLLSSFSGIQIGTSLSLSLSRLLYYIWTLVIHSCSYGYWNWDPGK